MLSSFGGGGGGGGGLPVRDAMSGDLEAIQSLRSAWIFQHKPLRFLKNGQWSMASCSKYVSGGTTGAVINSPQAGVQGNSAQAGPFVLVFSLVLVVLKGPAASLFPPRPKIPAPVGHDVVTGGMRLFTMPYGLK